MYLNFFFSKYFRMGVPLECSTHKHIQKMSGSYCQFYRNTSTVLLVLMCKLFSHTTNIMLMFLLILISKNVFIVLKLHILHSYWTTSKGATLNIIICDVTCQNQAFVAKLRC